MRIMTWGPENKPVTEEEEEEEEQEEEQEEERQNPKSRLLNSSAVTPHGCKDSLYHRKSLACDTLCSVPPRVTTQAA